MGLCLYGPFGLVAGRSSGDIRRTAGFAYEIRILWLSSGSLLWVYHIVLISETLPHIDVSPLVAQMMVLMMKKEKKKKD